MSVDEWGRAAGTGVRDGAAGTGVRDGAAGTGVRGGAAGTGVRGGAAGTSAEHWHQKAWLCKEDWLLM